MGGKRQDQDKKFMSECLELARKGLGYVSPNPLVGAVLVKNGRVIGKGYHQKFGGPHAEIMAIENARAKVEGATLYVNLEPCAHYGKTPPCTEAIISHGIRRVVVGMIDPNPLVKGRGIRSLRAAGIEVTAGVLQHECQQLNESFVKRVTTGLPFVALKIAQSLDGKIARPDRRSEWITSVESRKYVHQLRAQYDVVLVGARTVSLDNPRLTVRYVKGRNPRRIVLDGNLTSPASSYLFKDRHRAQTIVFCREDTNELLARKKMILQQEGVQVVEMKAAPNGRIELRNVLKELASMGVNSVLVEGGQEVFTQFVSEKLVDKAHIFIAPVVFGCKGLPAFGDLSAVAQSRKFTSMRVETIGSDLLVEAYF